MPSAIKIILCVLVSIAAVTDIRSRRIPNWLVLPGLGLGLALNALLFGWAGAKVSVSGAGLAFGIYVAFYLLHAMGAGDVKLMAAIGAIAGLKAWLLIFFFTAIAGGVVAFALLLIKGRFRRTLLNVSIMLHQLSLFQAPYHATEELDVRSGKALRLPHGVTIALGTITYLLLGITRSGVWY